VLTYTRKERRTQAICKGSLDDTGLRRLSGNVVVVAPTRTAMSSQSSAPNTTFATFANDNSAEYARSSVDAEDNDGDTQLVGNALID